MLVRTSPYRLTYFEENVRSMGNMTNPNRMRFADFFSRILGFGAMMGNRTSNPIHMGSHPCLSTKSRKPRMFLGYRKAEQK